MKNKLFVSIAVFALCGCAGTPEAYSTSPSAALERVTYTLAKKAGPKDIYPDVPGVTNPDVTQSNIKSTICVSGWTKTIRPPSSYTSALKKKQLADANSADQTPGHFEEDHIISLQLGGHPTDPKNLWPEPYDASIPDGGARTKDRVEGALKRAVCKGAMKLSEAQRIIKTDWYAYYLNEIAEPDDPDDE